MKNLLLTTLLFLSFAQAETFQCIVVGVTDGDTITCLTDEKKQVKVRLYQIDAPESGQAYGQKAKQALSDMIYGQTVSVENKGLDRYNRTFGVIYKYNPICTISGPCSNDFENIDVNLAMIQQGYAWHYLFTTKNPGYLWFEQEAKAARRGLWADDNPIPPWEWRKNTDHLPELSSKTLECKNGQTYKISYVHGQNALRQILYLYYKGRKIPLYGDLTNSGVIFYSDNPEGYRSPSDIYNWHFSDHIGSVFEDGVSVLQNEKLGVYCEVVNSKSF